MGVPCLCSYPKQNEITKKLNKNEILNYFIEPKNATNATMGFHNS